MPHDDKDDVKEEGDIKVMASHAIFRMDAGKEAPGCVVGFQFEQQAMYKRFREITSHTFVRIPILMQTQISIIHRFFFLILMDIRLFDFRIV